MRGAFLAAAALLLAGCAHPADHASVLTVVPPTRQIDPDNIRWVRRDLPPGYEARSTSGVTAPQSIWGVGAGGAASPARCGALADPGDGRTQTTQGVSGSGAGGTVYAVVVAAPASLDQALLSSCRHWSLTGTRAKALVHLLDPPRIDGAQSSGMEADITISVEGGSEISSRACTFTAYLSGFYAFTTVVSDPGSPNPALSAQYASDLLGKTVSALRG